MKNSIIVILLLIGSADLWATPINVEVDSTGTYLVHSPYVGISFKGKVEAPRGVSVETTSGQDKIGNYEEIRFMPKGENVGFHHYSIRTYRLLSSVLFSESTHDVAVKDRRFPRFTQFPSGNVQQLSYGQMEFAPTVTGPSGDAPWIYFTKKGESFILSPADHFMISNCFLDAEKNVSVGIESQVNQIAPVFRHTSILSFGQGVNKAYDNWGAVLLRMSGKKFVANDDDATLNTIGYWTDNRSSYWYNYDLSLAYAGTLNAIQKEFQSQGISLGHLQLDSWWYLKAGDAQTRPPLPISWKQANYQHGIYEYEAAPELFPNGLTAFHNSVGLPLATHARWVDAASPYMARFKFSNQVSIDPLYWDMIMKNLGQSGVEVYEQDWLNSKALPRLDRIHDADNFLDQMSAAASKYGIGLQYCMPLARHFMQGSRYSNLRTIRPSGDGFERGKWNQFLYGSKLATSMGIWPWADVFFSADRPSVLIATLSAGIVGVGDRLSTDRDSHSDSNPGYCGHSLNCRTLKVENLKRSIRADGVVVKPDRSLVPTDQSYLQLSGFKEDSAPMVAAAFTDSSEGDPRAAYIFSYSQNAESRESSIFSRPKDLGFNGDVYVYNYFLATGARVTANEEFKAKVDFNGSYFIVLPIDATGIAWLGDLDQFVSMGKKRIEVDTSSKHNSRIQIHFASGESVITVSALTTGPTDVNALHAHLGSIIGAQFDSSSNVAQWKIQRPEHSDVSTPAEAVLEFIR